MQRTISRVIGVTAALVSAVDASTWWPNATTTAPLPGSTSTKQLGALGLFLELGGNTVPAYDPMSATSHPDLSAATPVAAVPDGSECSIFAGDVNVYYYSTAAPTRTGCFTGSGAPPFPTDLAHPTFPSVYVVVKSLSAGNSHTRIGSTYASVIFSMKSNELSTIAGTAGPSQVFNFGDLPCPPPDVAAADKYFYDPSANPTRAYMPRIVPPSQILDLNPAWKSCTFPANFQFFDPPTALPDSSDDNQGPQKHRRDLEPQAPEAMITPAPAPIDWHRGHPRQVTY